MMSNAPDAVQVDVWVTLQSVPVPGPIDTAGTFCGILADCEHTEETDTYKNNVH